MDDLDKAILISFDESRTVNSLLKSQAVAFCQQIKDNPSICSICIERLCFSKLVQVQFWCLQCLHEVLRVRYSSMGLEEKSFIRKSLFSVACFEGLADKNSVRVLEGPAFIKNKLAQVLAILIYFEYPLIWSSVFVDFLPYLSKGAVVIDMFCRVLNSLDDELISLDYPRNAEETAVAARVKDAMREQCVAQIVRAWYDILSMYRNSDPDLCACVLDSMRRYISWIDIRLIVNDAFLRLLFELVLVEGFQDQVRGAAAICVLAVVSKRMEPQSKLNFIQSLQMSRVFGLLTEDNDSELVSKIAALVTGYAAEVLDCYKRLNAEDANGISLELLNEVLPSVFYVMRNCETDTTFSIVQFLSGYVATMKSLSPLRETQLLHVGQILEVILMQIQFDPMYRENLDMFDKIGKEEEERMMEFRKDLIVLFRSVGRVAPDVTQIFIRNSLVSSVGSSAERNVEEVEAALFLFHALGESLSDGALRTGTGLLKEMVPMLLSTRFPCHSNRLVALVYLDTITRYVKFVQENTQYIPLVLTAFLDERGIHHPNVNVSRRASYLFMRVVKSLKAKLVPFIETILQNLQDTISQFTKMHCAANELSGSEDGSHIFEAIGLLIGMENVPMEKQFDYLSSLLTPLCQQVEALLANSEFQNPEESPANIANIQQIIMAINALSKGFSERLVTASRPAIGIMFKKTLDVLLQILLIFPKIEPLRYKVTSFIHRMVETLGASVFPYLPKALEQLLAESDNFFPAMTKIVGTLGPKSRSVDLISGCLNAGMSVARFDFSWGDPEYHQDTLENLKMAVKSTKKLCAVMLHTVGPELQVVNKIEKSISLQEDGTVILTPYQGHDASPELLPINFNGLAKAVKIGDTIFVGHYLFTGSETTSVWLEDKLRNDTTMGRKGNWFSSVNKAFSPESKERKNQKANKSKKKGFGKEISLNHESSNLSYAKEKTLALPFVPKREKRKEEQP